MLSDAEDIGSALRDGLALEVGLGGPRRLRVSSGHAGHSPNGPRVGVDAAGLAAINEPGVKILGRDDLETGVWEPEHSVQELGKRHS